MILTKLSLWNFRKFSTKQEAPGVEIYFHKGVNALIGENNSGKTAIIDAIKIILQTQSNEYYRITEDDFHINEDGSIATEFKIECTFEEFTDDEAKNFIEWLQFKKDSDGKVKYFLSVQFNAWKEKNRIFTEFRAGMNEDGYRMDGKARELLKCTYLKPLRDAEHEMRSGRNSRISQILYNHSVFNSKEEHELVGIIKEANEKIENYFTKTDEGKKVLGKIESNFNEFLSLSTQEDTRLRTSNIRLKSILESLSKHPLIIWGRINGYGDLGPVAENAGFDTVAYWARTGSMMDFSDAETGLPNTAVIAFGDNTTACSLAAGVAAALYKQQEKGKVKK